jgi:cytochrome c
MSGCKADATISSELPAYARGSHGNLADQNRAFGPVRGAVTVAAAAAAPVPSAGASTGSPTALLGTLGFAGCHAVDRKILGPSFAEVAAKYKDQKDARAHLSGRIRSGGSGIWGAVPMPPQPTITDDELASIVDWLVSGAKP